MGRALGNMIINLKGNKEIKEAVEELGLDLDVIEDQEPDAALGNGGLGLSLIHIWTGILCYMKFSALLTQNLRKGSADMLRLLEQEAQDAFQKHNQQH